MADIFRSSGLDKKSPSIKQNRVTTQQISDGIIQLNGRNIVAGKVVDLNQILFGYTINDSTPLDESEGMLDNNELSEIKYNENEAGRAHAVYVRIPLIHDHLEDPLEKEVEASQEPTASQSFGTSPANQQGQRVASNSDKKRIGTISSHTRCTVDPTVANPTTPIHKNQFVGVRFLDYGYKYAHIVTLPNQSDIFAAIAKGDLSGIFGQGAGLGFGGATTPGGTSVGSYTPKSGSMILIGASTLTSKTRTRGISKRLQERGMPADTIRVAQEQGDLSFASSGFGLAKGGTNIRWFIPQLIKVLNNETEKQKYVNFSYVIFGFPNSNDMLKVPGADTDAVISNTQSALNGVKNEIDPISKQKIGDFLKPENLGEWFAKCLRLLCPSAELIYCPCAMRWGGASACQDYDSNFQYIKALGYYENFKIIKHVVIGSHHVAGEDNANRDTNIQFSKIVGSGGTDEVTWNRGNGITGITKQTDAWVDIAQGVSKNHFINSNSSVPAEPETFPLPIGENLKRFCEENYRDLYTYLKR